MLLTDDSRARPPCRSAASEPAAEINPAVLAVMAEAGVDLATGFSKPLTDEAA